MAELLPARTRLLRPPGAPRALAVPPRLADRLMLGLALGGCAFAAVGQLAGWWA